MEAHSLWCKCIAIVAADSSRHFKECPMRGLYPEASAEAQARQALIDAAPDLLAACEATVLFYNAAYWTEAEAARWRQLTGTEGATTKMLCDMHRAAIAKARGT